MTQPVQEMRKEHLTSEMTGPPDGMYAEWRGTVYRATDTVRPPRTVKLWQDRPTEGFEKVGGSGKFRRLVPESELTALFELKTFGLWKGERCRVLTTQEDGSLHLAWTKSNQARAAELGFQSIERGVFETVVPRSEVTDLRQERTEIPLA